MKKIRYLKTVGFLFLMIFICFCILGYMAMKLPGDLSREAVDRGQLMQNEAIATMRANELKNRQVKAVIAEQDKVTLKNQTHERELDAAFDEKFVPSPECENPSEALFVRCVNDRMRAKAQFFESHKFE